LRPQALVDGDVSGRLIGVRLVVAVGTSLAAYALVPVSEPEPALVPEPARALPATPEANPPQLYFDDSG
jgi:hypothetical protein